MQEEVTLQKAYEKGKKELKAAKINDANQDAWYLLEFCTKTSRLAYYNDPMQKISQEQVQMYETLLKKRASHVPIQYLIGEQAFMGLIFTVNPSVLIPRQDTELLVEVAQQQAEGKEVLELCTGSGCIIISLAYFCHLKRAVASDISEQALEVAKNNARKYHCNIEWMQSNLFSNLTGTYDMIIANPPYIAREEIKSLMPEVKEHEPILALDGGVDGLFFYREIIKNLPLYLKPHGKVFLEIGWDQAEQVSQLLQEQGFQKIRKYQDLAGKDRLIVAENERNKEETNV